MSSLTPRIDRLEKNLIINGNFDIQQRPSPTNLSSNNYVVDRFRAYRSGTSEASIARSTNVPPNIGAAYSLEVDVTTAESSPAASSLAVIYTTIEGYNIIPLINQYFTLSFWVMSPKTGKHGISFHNQGNLYSYSTSYTVNVANTWEFKTVLCQHNSGIGTWYYNHTAGLTVLFELMSGANFKASSENTWIAGDKYANDTVNVMDNTSNYFRIAQVMLNVGTQAGSFNRFGVDFSGELQACQRYYRSSIINAAGPAISTTACYCYYYLSTPLRVAGVPALVTGASFSNCIDETGTSARTPTSVAAEAVNTTRVVSLVFNGMSGLTQFRPCRLTADVICLEADF